MHDAEMVDPISARSKVSKYTTNGRVADRRIAGPNMNMRSSTHRSFNVRIRNVRRVVPLSLHNPDWSAEMKKTMIAIAIGAAALMGGTAANAASPDAAAKSTTAKQATETSQSTDISAQRRHRHGHRHHHHGHRHHHFHRHGHYRAYRPHYYNSYGYYGRPHGYYGGGPGITFSFGSGGYRGW